MRRFGSLRVRIAGNVSTARVLLAARTREFRVRHPKLAARAGVIACILIAALVVAQYVGGVAPAPSAVDSSVPVGSESPISVSPPTPNSVAPPVVPQQVAKRAAPKVPSRTAVVKNSSQPLRKLESPRIQQEPSSVVRTAGDSSGSVPAAVAAVASVPPVITQPATSLPVPAPVTASRTATAQDENSGTIYSAQDIEVRPPQMLEPELPRPAVTSWPTIRNSIEVVVAEDGSVERVQWLQPRGRMPDVMVLSRAKLWKFAPALKDGHAVRYRLTVSWDVNP